MTTELKTTNPLHFLKRSNRRSVLDMLRELSPLTIADISEGTGLSKVTVTKCLDHYAREGLVVCSGRDEAGEERGKRPARFSFNKLHRLVFCVKIDEVHMLAALTDFEGRIVASHSASYTSSTPLADVLACIRDTFHMLLERAERDIADCAAAVVGCHGVIDPELGVCFVSPHFSGWGLDIPIRSMVERLLPPGMPVHVNNWIHFHAYGELKAMAVPVSRLFLIGTEMEGVAGGLVIDGGIYRGSGSLSGEIAHMIVDTRPEAELCECGGRGCLEASVSPRRMEHKAGDKLRNGALSTSLCAAAGHDPAFAEIVAAADSGDTFARALMDEAIGHWAVGITNILQICDPELVIIQGEYAGAGDYFQSTLPERIRATSLVKMRKTVEIVYSPMGDEGMIRGAGTFAADRYFAAME